MNYKKLEIDTMQFYNNYYGHHINYIKDLYRLFSYRESSIIYFAGDSSLDNKHYVLNQKLVEAVNGYEYILNPPLMCQDICYHLSNTIKDKKIKNTHVINCAVEEATVSSKKTMLSLQDKFIRNHIKENDVLVISIGGNDLALHPSFSTIVNMMTLMWCNSKEYIRKHPENAWGMSHFINLFSNNIRNYIKQLIAKRIPRKVIVCSIYYPDKKVTNSWADWILNKLEYNNDPEKLQLIIDYIHKEAISKIKIKGVNIEYFAMSSVLDGNTSSDYVGRVEPSVSGGKKIANGLFNCI